MVDIYNERGYISVILSQGISDKWERDVKLLIKFFRNETNKDGSKKYTKRQVRELIENKLIYAGSRLDNNRIQYMNKSGDQDRFYRIFEDEWKKPEILRTIDKVEMPREVLDWFLHLKETYEIDDETVKNLKKEYGEAGINVSVKNKIMTDNRIKFLFTLYIWTRIQENYLEIPGMHYLDNYKKRFKQDADLSASFKMEDEITLLQDIGLIGVSPKTGGVNATFIKEFAVFNTPVTDENRIELKSDGVGEGDLYFPGYWLQKQKMGSFVCQKCGKEIAHYTKTKGEMGRKYCKECAKNVANHRTMKDGVKIDLTHRKCVDCGEEFVVSVLDHQSVRCDKCKAEYKKQQSRLRMQKMRHKSCDRTKNIIVIK